MEKVIKEFYSALEEYGFEGRIVSIEHLYDLKNEIKTRHDQGLFNEEFYQEALTFFSFNPPDDLPSAASMIIVAVPRPQTRVFFTLNERTLALTIPPTYVRYREVDKEITSLLSEWLGSKGYHTSSARLPDKLLAVRSGLAEYGRNNITYIRGMGSFYQLIVFYSDLPFNKDEWRESVMMKRCRDCRICQTKCPTLAITPERFLLHVERCLVFHNEHPQEYPFPDWIDPVSHNSLIGCMICQQSCPENKDIINRFENSEKFTNEETSLLLDGTKRDMLPAATKEKFKRLGMPDLPDILPRNLGIFFRECGKW